MQFNTAELQKQSCFKAAFEAASKSRAAQRSSSYAAFRSNTHLQRSVCVNAPICKSSTAQRSSSYAAFRSTHMLRLEATSIYSAAQRMCVRTFTRQYVTGFKKIRKSIITSSLMDELSISQIVSHLAGYLAGILPDIFAAIFNFVTGDFYHRY